MTRLHLVLALLVVAFTSACTGGRLVDAGGNAIKSAGYTVTFTNASTNAQYTTGVSTLDGTFSFDPEAGHTSSNDSISLPQGQYYVRVNVGTELYFNSHPVTVDYDNPSCHDYYNSSITLACSLFQLQINGGSNAVPYSERAALEGTQGYAYTVIPLGLWRIEG